MGGENGMNLLASSVVKAEESESFADIQLSHIRRFRAHHPDGDRARVSQGLVVIPTDSASAGQREKYLRYAESRTSRTTSPQGPARLTFEVDLVGASDEIAERLYRHQPRPGPGLAPGWLIVTRGRVLDPALCRPR
jgi:hypothetical protein